MHPSGHIRRPYESASTWAHGTRGIVSYRGLCLTGGMDFLVSDYAQLIGTWRPAQLRIRIPINHASFLSTLDFA
jgi:hypothetical protein